MFIAILTYKKPLGEVDRFLAAHREYLAEHYAPAISLRRVRRLHASGV